MLVKTLLGSILATAVSGAKLPRQSYAPDPGSLGCGTSSPTADQIAGHEQWALAEASQPNSTAKRADAYIDTYVHVVADSLYPSRGYLPRNTIHQQINVLNQAFQGTGFQSTLLDVDWTVNGYWANYYDESGMKSALRRGDYKTLNLYYVTALGPFPDLFGLCNYPVLNAGTHDVTMDGCVMSAWTAPGGNSWYFSTGRVTVHEVGHWHGLLHTFEGSSCNGYGDYVDDTPHQSTSSEGCPFGKDTCPWPGVDPIHNHMDYSVDTCRTQFTPGQVARMHSAWSYRA